MLTRSRFSCLPGTALQKNLNSFSVTLLFASNSYMGLSLLNLLLGNVKLQRETPSISTWEKK